MAVRGEGPSRDSTNRGFPVPALPLFPNYKSSRLPAESILPVNVEILHAVAPFPVRLAVLAAGFVVAGVDGNGLGGKGGWRMDVCRCF